MRNILKSRLSKYFDCVTIRNEGNGNFAIIFTKDGVRNDTVYLQIGKSVKNIIQKKMSFFRCKKEKLQLKALHLLKLLEKKCKYSLKIFEN